MFRSQAVETLLGSEGVPSKPNKSLHDRQRRSHQQVTKFRGDTPKKGTAPKLKFSKLTNIAKKIVYRWVNDSAESKSGLILGLKYFFTVILARFVANFENTR